MSEQETKVASKKSAIQTQIDAQINNERVFRDINSIQLSNIQLMNKIMVDLNETSPEERKKMLEIIEEHLEENRQSFFARYILGIIELQGKKKSNSALLELVGQCVKAAKWTVVDHISQIILDVDENNRIALRAKVDSMERLKSKTEIKPYLAKLAEIDRKNPEVLQKYANTIVDSEPEKALKLYKQAAEIYALLKDYIQLENLWELLVEKNNEDLAFFERIERIVVGNRDRLWMASQIIILLEPYRSSANWNVVIHLLKKVLQYEPNSTRARSDLVRAYREIYAEHSLLNEFLKVSGLTNHKKAIEACIASFERNIVFDKGNFVFHRTRGVGKIQEIDNEFLIIDFASDKGKKMSLKMAINSLYPLEKDHLWVAYYEDPQSIKEMFDKDIFAFFEKLLSSYKDKILIPDLKKEITKRFIALEDWSRWWTKARNHLKKDPRFSFNPRKKDELILRETPMTLADELSLRFQNEVSWHKKLEIGMSILKEKDVENALVGCIQFYRENEKNKEVIRKIHSFIFLEIVRNEYPILMQNFNRELSKIKDTILGASVNDLVASFTSTTVNDLKKEIMLAIIQHRQDYPKILQKMLFDPSIKAHRMIINELQKTNNEETLADFTEAIFIKNRENPEVFLWLARQVLTEKTKISWIKRKDQDIFLFVVRILPSLANIEKQGNKLKKQAMEIVVGNFNTITIDSLLQHELLVTIIQQVRPDMLRRIISLFREIPYIAKAHKENFEAMVAQVRPDYQKEDSEEKEARLLTFLPKDGEVLISEEAYKKRKEYIDQLVNVEMPANSRDIGEAQERGDLRENSEYKAALERQSQLRNEIETLSSEMKKAKIISKDDIQTDVITIGTKVFMDCDDGKKIYYSILGPWDVDTDKNIISYESKLARSLLGKKKSDEIKIFFDKEKTYQIADIVSAFA